MGSWHVADVGANISYFLLVKMSRAVMLAFAEPCLPVLACETSVHLHGKPFTTTYEPFLIEPTLTGVQPSAPAEKSFRRKKSL